MPRVERYLDFLSGFGVYALGRSHPALKAALHQAIDLDLPNMVQMDCALLPGTPGRAAGGALSRRRSTGSSSATPGPRPSSRPSSSPARPPSGRRILFAEHAFHGLSTGALALNGGAEFREGFGQLLPGSDSVPFGDLEALRRELKKRDVAAFIVEPIQGKGVYMAPPEYWKEAQELCRSHGTLLVLDEVQTGLGRTGKFFCFEHWDLKPDIITVSKALSGRLHPGRRRPDDGPGLLVGLQLPREGAEALDHVRTEPAGHGGRPRHSGHLRRGGHRPTGPTRPDSPSRRRWPPWSSVTRCSTRCGARA